MAETVKSLMFDVFGTVVDWRSSIAREIEALGRAKGFTVDPPAFADRWRALESNPEARLEFERTPF